MHLKLRCTTALAICLATAGCHTTLKSRRLVTLEAYCAPSTLRQEMPMPDTNLLATQLDGKLRGLSNRGRAIAVAVGLLSEIQQWRRLQDSVHTYGLTPVLQLELLSRREQMDVRLLHISYEIASITAEIDCEAERASLLASYLSGLEERRLKRLTILSLVVAAGTGIATSIWQQKAGNSPGETNLAIAGGAVSSGLALAAFLKAPKLTYLHPRNLLQEVWKAPTNSAYFPASVWFYLTRPEFSNDQQKAIRTNLLRRWGELGRNAHLNPAERKHQEDLFFGQGGDYNAGELSARADLLNQLQAEIRTMSQDIELLTLELGR